MGVGSNVRETGAYIYSPTWQFQTFGKRFMLIYNETETYFLGCKSTAYLAAYWNTQGFVRLSKLNDIGDVEINVSFQDWVLSNPSKNIIFQFAKFSSGRWNITQKTSEIGLEISYPNLSILTNFGMYRDSHGNPQYIVLAMTSNDATLYKRFSKGSLSGYYFTARANSTVNPYIIYTRTY